MSKATHKVHMISFQRIGEMSHNVIFGDGRNVAEWHLDMLEEWIAEQRALLAADDGSDLV